MFRRGCPLLSATLQTRLTLVLRWFKGKSTLYQHLEYVYVIIEVILVCDEHPHCMRDIV